uniref:Splicing factor RBM39 linker domain-containing protein n=1 Tax=Taeniopygia guttata TaxID=59729 RepID=A0A674GWB2_TAEGU
EQLNGFELAGRPMRVGKPHFLPKIPFFRQKNPKKSYFFQKNPHFFHQRNPFFSPQKSHFFPKKSHFFPKKFSEAECARRALEQLNGFELAGRPMRVGQVSERPDGSSDVTFPEGTPGLGTAAGRLQLMAKLAEGSGLQLPAPAQAALQQLNGALNPLGGLNPAALTDKNFGFWGRTPKILGFWEG